MWYILDRSKFSEKKTMYPLFLLFRFFQSYKLSKVLFHLFMVILLKVKEIHLSEIYIQLYPLSCRHNIMEQFQVKWEHVYIMIFHVCVVKVTGSGSSLPEGCADMICRSIFKEVQVQTLSQTDRCAVYNIYSTLLSQKLPGKIQKMFPQILIIISENVCKTLFFEVLSCFK